MSIVRSIGDLSLGSANLSIDANGTTRAFVGGEERSEGHADWRGPQRPRRAAGGRSTFSLPGGDGANLYLDSANGGGLIGAATVSLPLGGKTDTSGGLALGFYANSPHTVTVLGGTASLPAIDLGGGWSFGALTLTYQSAADTWSVSGGLSVPIGSLSLSGSVVGGSLNSLAAAIGGLDVPLGDTGFFFSGFGGSVSGLARPPLVLSASTMGFWGAPGLPVEPFYLDNVSVTVNFGGSVTLAGAVSSP